VKKNCILCVVCLSLFSIAGGAQSITEIIDETGDATGNPLNTPRSIATDGAGNVYLCGGYSNNAYRISLGLVFADGFETGDTSKWLIAP
jgi:hypothetical protein